MKKRIEQLLNGIFEYEPAKLVLLPKEIEVHARLHEVVHGSFQIEREDRKKVKGFLYSSSPRVVCSPVEFQGISNEIHYQVDVNGCGEGFEEEGFITICSECGEDTLPFRISIEKKPKGTEVLPFADTEQFARLAQEDFQVAYRWFLTKEFRSMLEKEDRQLFGFYEALSVSDFSYESMEEFLCAAQLKEPIRLFLDKDQAEWKHLSETLRKTIVISKSTWGFQKIKISSDADFLCPEKKMLTADEFAGSSFDLNLVVDTNLMHSGRNYARLILETPHQKLTLPITAHKAEQRTGVRSGHICKIMMKKLEALYVEFRLKKIDLETWIERSVSVINSYKRAGGTDLFADLFLVQLYFAEGHKQKAYELLESFDNQREFLNTPEKYGFYLYLTTFFYQEAAYVDRVEAELTKMFFRDKTNWKLRWILLYLQEEFLKNDNLKYEAVEEQFRFGCRSRILYLEAYQILKSNPFQMRRLGAFELALLRFGAQEKVLSAELVRQCANLTMHQQTYSQRLYEILTEGYRLYPSDDLVKSICYLLMKGGKKEEQYFEWYEKGVDAGLRITGLYEYYMETMVECDIRRVPQIIRMYFAYDTSIDYRKRAAIYRQMVEMREHDLQTWQQYRGAMEKFTLDQLESGRISEDLAVLYQTFLKENMLTRQSAARLARLLFSYEVKCENPEYTQVIVHSPCMKGEYIKPVSEGHAIVRIYDLDSTVLLADANGNRYSADSLCSIRRIFENEDMLSWCAKKVPEYPGIVLYLCTQCLAVELINQNTLQYYLAGCRMEELTDSFRDRLRMEVLQYFMENQRDPFLSDFLKQIDLPEYVKVDKAALITLLAEEGMCQEAFTLLDTFGAEGIPLIRLVRICSRMVLDLEFEENPMLLSLCFSCFSNGKYDDKVLRYLLLYYEGPVQEMKRVWHAARKFELDTMLLEEKIMMMMLFTRSGTHGSEPVFEAYLEKLGRKRLCRAYANLKAYEYFVKGNPVAECVFTYIEKEYQYLAERGRLLEQEEIARLALLLHYAKSGKTDAQRGQIIRQLLEEFAAKGMKFAFWKRFDKEFLKPYQMEGKVFAEYVCHPEHTVAIYFRKKGSTDAFVKENVDNYFEGVFVKEFTLFTGEELECYLEEDDGKSITKTDLRLLCCNDFSEDSPAKSGLMNRIISARANGDDKQVWEQIENWKSTQYFVDEIFTLV